MDRADRLRNDERILRAAAEVLAADPGASMQAVADAAGVARLSVYRRYPDRATLIAALRAAADDELDRALDAVPAWTDGVDADNPLRVLVSALAGVAARYPVALLRYAPGADAPPAADARVAAVLRRGQQAGEIRDDVPAETLNAALFGVLSAVLDTDAGLDPEAVPATVLALLAPGLTTRTAHSRSSR